MLRTLDALQSDEICPCNWQKAGTFIVSAIASCNAEVTRPLLAKFGGKLDAKELAAARGAVAVMTESG